MILFLIPTILAIFFILGKYGDALARIDELDHIIHIAKKGK